VSGSKRHPNFRLKEIALLTSITAVTVLGVVLLMSLVEQNIAKANIRNTAQRAGEEFQRMRGQAEGFLRSAREYGVDPSNIEAAQNYFHSTVFKHIPELSGISLAEADGPSFYLSREGQLRDVRADSQYDPEERVWFKGALNPTDSNECFWSPIYQFYTKKEEGISASLSWQGGNKRPVVVAYDILLDDFKKLVQELAPTPSSLVFVFSVDTNRTVYIASAGREELAREGVAIWKKQLGGSAIEGVSGNILSSPKMGPTRIGGAAWLCGFVPLTKAEREVWLGVMVPKPDLVDDAVERWLIYAGIGLMVLAAIVMIYLILSRRQPTPLFAPELNQDQVRELVKGGENQMVEFKSTMRMNLHSKKPGKEIEQAWLKGVAAFMNTSGGTLLLGVTDAGEIAGLEQDVFENDDKCRLHFKNLIAKSLGADLSKFIRFTLVPMDGKTVGVVQCSRASRPVYLKDGNKETFYIRNGPSSDELPASRMVDYIAEHWK